MRSALHTRLIGVAISATLVSCALGQDPPPPPTTDDVYAISREQIDAMDEAQSLSWAARLRAHYYTDPKPDRVADALSLAARLDQFDTPATAAPWIGWMSGLFIAHPDRIDAWIDSFEPTDANAAVAVGQALQYVGTDEARERIKTMAAAIKETSPPAAARMRRFAHPKAPPLLEEELDSVETISLLIGRYFAAGDVEYAQRITLALDFLPFGNEPRPRGVSIPRMAVGAAARWTLTSVAKTHPPVLEMLKDVASGGDAAPRVRAHARAITEDVAADRGAQASPA